MVSDSTRTVQKVRTSSLRAHMRAVCTMSTRAHMRAVCTMRTRAQGELDHDEMFGQLAIYMATSDNITRSLLVNSSTVIVFERKYNTQRCNCAE